MFFLLLFTKMLMFMLICSYVALAYITSNSCVMHSILRLVLVIIIIIIVLCCSLNVKLVRTHGRRCREELSLALPSSSPPPPTAAAVEKMPPLTFIQMLYFSLLNVPIPGWIEIDAAMRRLVYRYGKWRRRRTTIDKGNGISKRKTISFIEVFICTYLCYVH